MSAAGKRKAEGSATPRAKRGRKAVERTESDADRPLVDAVMRAAEKGGLLREKTSRISGRVSPLLIEKAKRRTGIEKDSDLIAYALANVALEDEFTRVFREMRGTVDPDLDLEF